MLGATWPARRRTRGRGDKSAGQRGTNAPVRRRITGAAGPTLPPPTGPWCRPRRGVLAAGRAGIAAGSPGPEVSGRSQPWLQSARRSDGFRLCAGRMERGSAEGRPDSPWPRPRVGGASAGLSGDPAAVFNVLTTTQDLPNCVEGDQCLFLNELKDLLDLLPTHLLKKHFSAQNLKFPGVANF